MNTINEKTTYLTNFDQDLSEQARRAANPDSDSRRFLKLLYIQYSRLYHAPER